MSNVIKTHPFLQMVCHMGLVSLWTYWAIAIGHINDGVWGWITLIVVGLGLLVGGAYCLIMESDVSEGDDDDMHFFFYGIISMIPLGIILYNTIIYPALSYLFLGLYIGIFLLLYNFKSFSAGILLFTLTIIPLYVICNFTKWYDYVIVGVITLFGFIMILFTAGKSATNSTDLDNSDERALLLGCFFGWILYSLGTAYYLMGYQILSQDWLSIPFIIFPVLLSLCATTRIMTVILGVIGGVVYLVLNWKTISFEFFKVWVGSLWGWIINGFRWIGTVASSISFEWIHSTWFIITMCITGTALIVWIVFKLHHPNTVYITREDHSVKPISFKEGYRMSCPKCRNMTKGKIRKSEFDKKSRPIVKTTVKGAVNVAGYTGGVGGGFKAGAALGACTGPAAPVCIPIFAVLGALGGAAVVYKYNKNLDDTVDSVYDYFSEEDIVDLEFHCDNCDNEWNGQGANGRVTDYY